MAAENNASTESPNRLESTWVIISQLRPGAEADFARWEGRLNSGLFNVPGFVSLESQSPQPPFQKEWINVVRFDSPGALKEWAASPSHESLVADTRDLVEGRLIQLPGSAARTLCSPHSVTEVIVTQLNPGRETAYRAWAGRIQEAFSRAPGFQGVTSQRQMNGKAWTTLMRFDNAENLDRWLKSSERAAFLDEAKDFIEGVHLHRVEPSFPGWVGVDAAGQPPPRWKTTMLVLLSLYPIANFDLTVIFPLLPKLPWGISYFLPYCVGVILISYLAMPFFVRLFGPWLYAGSLANWKKNLVGISAILALYAVEIVAVYWIVHGGFR